MKSIVSTLIGGAIGLAALYVVGRIAYRAGHDVAEAEHRCEEARRAAADANENQEAPEEEGAVGGAGEDTETPAPVKKQGRLRMLLGLGKMFRKNGASVIGDLVQNPENHVVEACIKGREIHVNVKPRTV